MEKPSSKAKGKGRMSPMNRRTKRIPPGARRHDGLPPVLRTCLRGSYTLIRAALLLSVTGLAAGSGLGTTLGADGATSETSDRVRVSSAKSEDPTRAPAVNESAREIPVAYEVDVVVVGATTGAVEAARTAAQAGAKVFLAAPRPYLGDDMTATLRLWLVATPAPTSGPAPRTH
ncbi:MAG TPA: FAD-dependent oxidoreductase, partial [Planctomycetaceae bacterium]|nr:FAD-dependent oxidoreductase [Planctomycetaceae bacterium]